MIKGRYPGLRSLHCGDTFIASDPAPTPLDLFDQQRWAECAHSCIYLLWRLQDPERALVAMNDEKYLHELLHLATGVEISTHNKMEFIRSEISDLMNAFESQKSK